MLAPQNTAREEKVFPTSAAASSVLILRDELIFSAYNMASCAAIIWRPVRRLVESGVSAVLSMPWRLPGINKECLCAPLEVLRDLQHIVVVQGVCDGHALHSVSS